jgi:hypothetical protein
MVFSIATERSSKTSHIELFGCLSEQALKMGGEGFGPPTFWV